MKISFFLAKYAILAAILNFRTLAVSNVIGGQIFWQIRVLHHIWPWKQPVLFQICKKSSDMPNPNIKLVEQFTMFTYDIWHYNSDQCLSSLISA